MSNDTNGAKTEAKPAVQRVKIKLTGPHTHRGVGYVKGDEIEVREDQAKRLIDSGRAVAP